jgi:hypothetical protein
LQKCSGDAIVGRWRHQPADLPRHGPRSYLGSKQGEKL